MFGTKKKKKDNGKIVLDIKHVKRNLPPSPAHENSIKIPEKSTLVQYPIKSAVMPVSVEPIRSEEVKDSDSQPASFKDKLKSKGMGLRVDLTHQTTSAKSITCPGQTPNEPWNNQLLSPLISGFGACERTGAKPGDLNV